MRQQIASAVDLIIQANRLQGGPRKITHITEVMNMEQDMIIMQDIFRFKQLGIDQNGRAFGQFEATGVRPTLRQPAGSEGHQAAVEPVPGARAAARLSAISRERVECGAARMHERTRSLRLRTTQTSD